MIQLTMNRSFRAAQFLFVWLVGLNSLFAEGSGAVTMAPWTTNSTEWEQLHTSELLQELVAAELLNDSSNRWVERTQLDLVLKELNLSGAGYTSTHQQIRFAQLTGAELLVLGRVESDLEDKPRIRLEIVDLARADVLTSRLMAAESANLATIDMAQKVSEEIREALNEARKVRSNLADKTHVALLYFRNAASTGRLDFLSNDLREQMASSHDTTSNVRIVQFPKASDAISEAELIADGLVAGSENGRTSLADQFVWGEYEEINSSGVPFPQVEVRLKLYRWNGGRQLDQTVLQSRVADLPQLFEQAAKWVLASKKQPEPFSDETAKKLAEDIYQQAREIQQWILQPMPQNGNELSPDWLRKWRQTISLLSLAAFFDPSHAAARRELVIETTREDIDNRKFPENRGYGRTVQRSRAWAHYVERFGFDFDQPSISKMPSRQGTLSDNRLIAGEDAPLIQLIRSAEQRLKCVAPNYDTRSRLTALKLDSQKYPPDVVQRWLEEASQDYIDRYALAVRQRPDQYMKRAARDMQENMRYLATDQQRVEFAEKLWPLIEKHPVSQRKSYERLLHDPFSNTGQDGRLQELLATLKSPEPTSPKPAPPQMASPGNGSQSIKTPQVATSKQMPMKPIYVGGSFRDVGTLAVELADGQIWIAMGDRFSSTKYQLLCFVPETNKIHPIGLGGTKPAIMDLCRHQEQMWIASENLGVMAIDLKGNKLHKFDERSGLPSNMTYCLAAHGQTVYCGGGADARGTLAAYDLQTEEWTAYALPVRQEDTLRPATPRVEELAFDGKYLACFAHAHGAAATLLIRPVGNSDWTRLDQRLLDQYPQFSMFGPSHRRLMVVDLAIVEDILWIASTEGLLGYHIVQDKFIFAEQLAVLPTAMQANEQGLWLACLPRTKILTGQSAATGAAILRFDPAAKKWTSQTPLPNSGMATDLDIEQDQMALGMGGDRNTVTVVRLP